MKLIFDTETTGLARFDLPPSDPLQPRLVSIAMILLDDEDDIVNECSFIIRPEGFTIPTEASNVHGITTEYALKYGIRIDFVLGVFKELCEKSSLIIGHNLRFDEIIVFSEIFRFTKCDISSKITNKYCTMLETTPIMKLPTRNGRGYKWPKLSEAYEYFFNEPLVGAHDALADVRATHRLYKHLQKSKIPIGLPSRKTGEAGKSNSLPCAIGSYDGACER